MSELRLGSRTERRVPRVVRQSRVTGIKLCRTECEYPKTRVVLGSSAGTGKECECGKLRSRIWALGTRSGYRGGVRILEGMKPGY